MTDREQVLLRLRQVAARLQARASLSAALVGMALTAACSGILVFASKLAPIPHAPWIAAVAVAAGAVAGALLAPRVSLRQAAIHADLAGGTEEVLSTALEAGDASRFGAAALAQAAAAARARPAARLTARAGRPPWALLVPIVLLGALLLAPPLPGSVPAQAVAQVSPEKLRRLEKDAKDLKRLSVEIESRELAHVSQQIQRLASEIRDGKMDKKEALARIAALAEKAEGIRKDLEAQKKSLAELGKNPETKALADALGRGDMDAAKKEAAKLGQQLADGKLSRESKGALKDALSKMATESKPSSEALAESASRASDALGAGDPGAFSDRMGKLAESMKGARSRADGKRGGSKGAPGSQGGGEESAPGELDDALADLEEAEKDLSESGESSAGAGKDKH
jgi:hypothetical protein